MKPSDLSAHLRRIAAAIDNSKSPSRDLVARDLNALIHRIAAPEFKLKEFKAPSAAESLKMNCWGGGHTHETDPTRKGWRCKVVPGKTDLLLIGQAGKDGCASVMQMSGKLDVAIYEEDPITVEKYLKGAGEVSDPLYKTVPNVPGWGLYVIDEIEKDRKNY